MNGIKFARVRSRVVGSRVAVSTASDGGRRPFFSYWPNRLVAMHLPPHFANGAHYADVYKRIVRWRGGGRCVQTFFALVPPNVARIFINAAAAAPTKQVHKFIFYLYVRVLGAHIAAAVASSCARGRARVRDCAPLFAPSSLQSRASLAFSRLLHKRNLRVM